MKVFIVCLACYNENRETGTWFDVSDYSDSNEMLQAIGESQDVCSHKELNHEEIAIHDTDNCPKGVREYSQIETLFEYQAIIEEIGCADATKALCNYFHTLEDFLRDYKDYTYCGQHKAGDYMYELLCDTEEKSTVEFIKRNSFFIDFDAMENQLLNNDGYLFLDSDTHNEFHVFSPNYR